MKNKAFFISGYWKDSGEQFENYLVLADENQDSDQAFYSGLDESEIEQAIKEPENTDLEFVITSYEVAEYV
jgi:hypothetical protein